MKQVARIATLAAAMGLLGTSSPASALPPPPGFSAYDTSRKAEQPRTLPKARKIEDLPNGNIELKVGERRSFRNVDTAGNLNPKVMEISVDDDILTIRGLSAGRAQLMVIKKSKRPPTGEQIANAPKLWIMVNQ